MVAPLLAMVSELGGSPERLLRRFGLPSRAATEPDMILPLRTLRALCDAAATELRDPFLGVRLAQYLPRGAYGIVEYTWRSAATIGEGLDRIVRYVRLLNDLVMFTFERRNGQLIVQQQVEGDPDGLGRHGNEFVATMLVNHCRLLTASPCTPTSVWFTHKRPDEISELVEALGTEDVRFGAETNGVALDEGVLELPLLSHDPALLHLLERHADQALAGISNSGPLVSSVRRRIKGTLGGQPPTLESTAHSFGMSPRTLQRRLANDGVAFHDLVDAVRRELAIEYVRDARRPLGEIAYLLGYSELSPFLRAFRRWTGTTPGAVRGTHSQ